MTTITIKPFSKILKKDKTNLTYLRKMKKVYQELDKEQLEDDTDYIKICDAIFELEQKKKKEKAKNEKEKLKIEQEKEKEQNRLEKERKRVEQEKEKILKAQEKQKSKERKLKNMFSFPKIKEGENGAINVPTLLENTKAIVDSLKIKVKYNEMSKEREIKFPSKVLHKDLEQNSSIFVIHDICRQNDYNITRQDLDAHLVLLGEKNAYHPVKDFILSKPWDGKSRLNQLFDTVISDHPMKKILMIRWLLSCVAAVFEPDGIAAQGMLVFVGPQGLGKTTWITNLAGNKDWVKEGVILKTQDKDSVLKVISHWIIEIGELGATFTKSDVNDLKAFMTERTDVVRPPYLPQANKYARRTILYGSVDRREYLIDSENRRFWSIDIDALNPYFNFNVQQVWAEIYSIYCENKEKKDGELCWILTRKELNDLRTHNQAFKTVDPLEEMLMKYVENPNNVATLDGDIERLTCTEILKRIGFDETRIKKVQTNATAEWLRNNQYEFNKNSRRFVVSINELKLLESGV